MEICVAFLFYIVVIAAQQIVDRTEFGAGDQFTVTCNVAKLIGNIPTTYVTQLNLQRKLLTDQNFVDIAIYYPAYEAPNTSIKNIPAGKSWDIQFSGGAGTGNRNTIKIVMISNNSSCNDSGLYRCAAIFFGNGNTFNTSAFNLTATAPINQNDIVMVPHNEQGDAYTSYNQVWENVTMTCSYTGPLNLQTVWKYTTQGSSEQNYPYTNDIIESTPQIASNTSGCTSYAYSSVLYFQLTQMDDGNTYYCTVQYNGVERSRRNFTIRSKAVVEPTEPTVPINIIQLPIAMTPQRGKLYPDSSLNKVGENITLTCKYSGIFTLRSTWKTARKGSNNETTYPNTNDITESTLILNTAGSTTYAYTSTLAFHLQENDDGNTYYCIVMYEGAEVSRRNFTIGVDHTNSIQEPIAMVPQRGDDDPYSSLNYVGENITLICKYSGLLTLRSTWRFARKGSKIETTYLNSNDITESTLISMTSVSTTYSYTSTLVIQLQEKDDGNTYFCIVMYDGAELSRRNFTIGIDHTTLSDNQRNSATIAYSLGLLMEINVVLFAATLFWS